MIGLLTLAIAAQLYFYIRRIQKRQTFLRASQTATATLVGKNSLDTALGEEVKYYLFCQFRPDFTMRLELILYKIHTGRQMAEYHEQFKIGDPIEVAYLPDDPKRSAPIQLPDYTGGVTQRLRSSHSKPHCPETSLVVGELFRGQ